MAAPVSRTKFFWNPSRQECVCRAGTDRFLLEVWQPELGGKWAWQCKLIRKIASKGVYETWQFVIIDSTVHHGARPPYPMVGDHKTAKHMALQSCKRWASQEDWIPPRADGTFEVLAGVL